MEQKPMEIEPNPIRDKMKDLSAKLMHKIDAESLRRMLREKCRLRMRDDRRSKHDKYRGLQMETDAKPLLTQAIFAGMRELEECLELEQEVLDELFAESMERLLKEMEKELEYYASAEEHESITCPICLLREMTHVNNNNQMKCDCGTRFHYAGDPKDFNKLMEDVVSRHQSKCSKNLTFYVEPTPDRNVLCAVCRDCEYLHEI